MSELITITIQPFGVLRERFNNKPMQLNINKGSCLADVKTAMVAEFNKQSAQPMADDLLDYCVFADGQQILARDACLHTDTELNILPPVSGG